MPHGHVMKTKCGTVTEVYDDVDSFSALKGN